LTFKSLIRVSALFSDSSSRKIKIMETQSQTRPDWLRICLIVLALSYAFLAGLRTVSDLDLGWQLATGRYLVQHHQIPRVDVFSYTARGQEWIYPPFSGAIFYLLYLAGGYSALSWLGALACAATVACMIAPGGRLVAILSIVAIPAIAFRTIPRAELFTTILFAAALAIIWRHHRGKRAGLWLLPGLFLLWANLHLGFISGLALLGAGALFEICDAFFAERRASALMRLKQLVPWAGASVVATFVNPWGWRIYEEIVRQNRVMRIHSAFIGEWSAVHFNSLALRQMLDARDPASADWWLLAVAAVAILVALWKKQFGPAIVLAAGMYLSVEHIRLQALFAILAAVIGGTILSEFAGEMAARATSELKPSEEKEPAISTTALSPWVALVAAAAFAFFVAIRVADLVTQHYYIDSGQISLFGTGPSWWYPERAANFIKREHLPQNIFHDYSLGGYLTWRIGPEYPDFVDGRYIPFGNELFDEQRLLASLGPDSPEWLRAADRWHFNTAIFPVARYAGLGTFALQEFCASNVWKPVYLDDVSIIFLRNSSENSGLIERLGIRCENAPINPPDVAPGDSYRARAERFEYLMNAAAIEYALSRDDEAKATLAQAEQIFPDDPGLHLVKAQMLAAENQLGDAEREYLRVVNVRPSDAAWFALARLYSSEHLYPAALRCVKEATPLSQIPYERWRSAGVLYLYMNQPQNALAALDQAERESPYKSSSSDLAKEFNARIAEARALAYRQLNELDRAIAEQKLATNLTPENSARWTALAELYDAEGQSGDSSQARLRAQAIRDAAKNHKEIAKIAGH
jgi:tetratricopeptide (TPR) repeat protein